MTYRVPTYEQCVQEYALQGKVFHGGHYGPQARGIRQVLNHPRSTFQGPRQIMGKTDADACIVRQMLLNGGVVLLGMNTLIQAEDTLWYRVMHGDPRCPSDNGMDTHIANGTIARGGKSTLHKTTFSNGAMLLVRSMANTDAEQTRKPKAAGRKGGLTVHSFCVDEAMGAYDRDIMEMLPYVSLAMAEGTGRIWFSGVGGPMESIIENRKNMGYHTCWFDADAVLKYLPQYRDIVEQAKMEMVSEAFDANYSCLPITMGTRRLYPDMANAGPVPANAGTGIHTFSCDVGRVRDFTVIAHKIIYPAIGLEHLVDFKQIPHGNLLDQARWVFDYIDDFPWVCDRYQSYIGVETNGISQGLCDALRRLHDYDKDRAGFPYITAVNVNEKMIHSAVQSLRVKFRNGAMQISPEARAARLGDPPRRIDDLNYTINEKGEYKYEHHDGNSALIIGEFIGEGGLVESA